MLGYDDSFYISEAHQKKLIMIFERLITIIPKDWEEPIAELLKRLKAAQL